MRRTSALSPSRQTAANVRFLYARSEDRKLRPCLKNVNHILHTVSGNTDTSVQWPETVCRCDLLSEKLRIYPGGRDAAVADGLSPPAQHAGRAGEGGVLELRGYDSRWKRRLMSLSALPNFPVFQQSSKCPPHLPREGLEPKSLPLFHQNDEYLPQIYSSNLSGRKIRCFPCFLLLVKRSFAKVVPPMQGIFFY